MTCYFIKRWSNFGIWICHPVSCRVSKSFTMPYLKTYSLFTLDIWHVVVDRNCLVFCLHGVQKIPIKVIIEQWPALYAINVLIENLQVRLKHIASYYPLHWIMFGFCRNSISNIKLNAQRLRLLILLYIKKKNHLISY